MTAIGGACSGGGGDATARRGKSPRCLMARAINNAVIASHAADTRSSTALPTPAGPERDAPARWTLPRAYKFREATATAIPPSTSWIRALLRRHHQRIALIGGQAFRFRNAQFLSHHVGAEHQRDHFVKGVTAAHAFAAHAAIRRNHQTLGRNIFERGADLRRHLVG